MNMEKVTFFPQGDHAVTITFNNMINKETHVQVRHFSSYLHANPFVGMIEVVPSYTTVTIYYDPLKIQSSSPYEEVVKILKNLLSNTNVENEPNPKTVTIPVCYGGKYGPDLSFVASYHHLTEQKVIELHTNAEYLVYMIGFAPGFPYLGGMSEKIATPRKDTPRVSIPAGSVGIGGEQTGVYPIESPGGWQLIGQTPVKLFDQHATKPSLIKTGDMIRFEPITSEQFENWEVTENDYKGN